MQQLTGAKEYPILNVSVLFDDKQFSQSDIASDISALTLTLTVNGPLSCSWPNKDIAGSLEAAYSLNWGAQEIWGKGGGENLALLW